jgi:hypothetical protein
MSDAIADTIADILTLLDRIMDRDFDGREPFAHFDVEQIVSTLRDMAELGPEPEEPEAWELAYDRQCQRNDYERKR